MAHAEMTLKQGIDLIAYAMAVSFLIIVVFNLPWYIAILLGAMGIYVKEFQMPKNAGKQTKPAGNKAE